MRFQFLKTEFVGGVEVAYVIDTETGDVIRSEVKSKVSAIPKSTKIPMSPSIGGQVPAPMVFDEATAAAPVAVKEPDPTGEVETPEQRKERLGRAKVPPAFLGDIRKMSLDPAKTDGRTDVTPHH